MEPPRVFISMGTPFTDQYARFRDELENLLRDRCGVNPRIIGKNEYPPGNPLSHIRAVMRECHGIVVVAYERTYLEKGLEKRGGLSATKIGNRAYTTPWNHIESAIAYGLDLPIYILCQSGLTEEGLIETKADWYVQHLDFLPETLSKPEIAESIRAWINGRVVPRAKKPRVLEALRGNLKFAEMSPNEVLAWAGMLSVAFLLGVGVALTFPRIVDVIMHH
jgi:hypothetical protein